MSNLVLTRKAGQSVRLIVEGKEHYFHVESVNSRTCFVMYDTGRWMRFRDTFEISPGVTVTLVDIARGCAKLCFSAPREVAILRTELIKELA